MNITDIALISRNQQKHYSIMWTAVTIRYCVNIKRPHHILPKQISNVPIQRVQVWHPTPYYKFLINDKRKVIYPNNKIKLKYLK